jgi:hypothetical protein
VVFPSLFRDDASPRSGLGRFAFRNRVEDGFAAWRLILLA